MSEPTENGAEICEVMDMQRQGCDHCRRSGAFVPAPANGTPSRVMKLDEEISLAIDADGDLWLGPDETFRRMGRD